MTEPNIRETRSDRADPRSSSQQDRIPRLLFVLSLLMICFGYGFVAGSWRLPPYDLIHKAFADFHDIWRYWRNDLGLEPTRHLVPRRGEKGGFVSIDRKRMAPGNRLIAGLTASRATLHGIVLYDPDVRNCTIGRSITPNWTPMARVPPTSSFMASKSLKTAPSS